MGKSSGAPCHLNKEQEAELINIILTKTPDEVGFTTRKNWDTTIIRQLAFKLYGVSYCQRGMLQVLYRNGLSFTRPTYSLEKADKSMIRDYQAISKTWFLKGRQRIIPTTCKYRGVKLLGTLNYETGQVFCTQDERYYANVFLEFLKKPYLLYFMTQEMR